MLLVFFIKLSFIVFMVKFFFLLSNFLVVEDYELYKSTSHLLSAQLTLEYVRILTWSIFFFSTSIVSLMVFCVRLLSELMILLSTSWDSLWVLIWSSNQNRSKIFIFFIGYFFWFWSVKIWYLKLFIQAQTLKAVTQS